jgi:RNA polymerase sigma-70 factor (ECF subfamily)
VRCESRAKSCIAEAAETKKPAGERDTGKANRGCRTEDVVSDDELAHRVREGDDDAWNTLVERYHVSVFRACWRSTGNMADADELAQDVWTRMWENRNTIRDGGFISRIFAITRNLCIDESRKAKHRSEKAAELGDAEAGEVVDVAHISVPDTADLRVFAEELLAVLPEQERRILLMLFVEGMTLQEIGAAEGCSHTSIATIRDSATKRILEWLSRGA